MPEVAQYPPGTVSWVELASPDGSASRRFYGELFGWTSYTLILDQIDDYGIFTLNGQDDLGVAGMQFLTGSGRASWTCYLRTEDMDASIERVREAGGRVLVDPMQVTGLGSTAMCGDREGAVFALYLPRDLQGAIVANEPATMWGAELNSADPVAAEDFYASVFGWQATPRDGGIDWVLDGTTVASLVRRDESCPLDWIPYFQVTDCGATARHAVELGGRRASGPFDSAEGRRCVLTDKGGACFGVITPSAD